MISKTLLTIVLGKTIIKLKLKNNKIVYVGGNTQKRKKINIYELAHKCKEWAYTQGYNLKSEITGCLMCQRTSFMWSDEEWFNGSSEIEAVIKACEYILQQSKKGD